MFLRRMVMLVLALVLGATMSACNWSIERNEDGSWKVTGTIKQAELQDIIDESLDDPLISNVQADFHAGYVTVAADRKNPDTGVTEPMTFRVDLSVVNEHLGVSISDVQLAGEPLSAGYVSAWNERMASRLERAGKRNPDSTLQAVTVTDNDVTMVWRVESRRSKND